jgi:single-strand DNA-binding protein
MSGFNQVILLGRVGNDPESKFTQGGTAVVSISLATSRRRKDNDDQWQEITSWHRVKFFGKQAEIIQEHVRKGDLLFVEGRLDYWEAKSDRGAKLMVAEIIGEHFEFGGGRRSDAERQQAPAAGSTARQRAREAVHGSGEGGAAAAGAGTGQQKPFDEPFDDDIPF